jgi:hypothetical protein
MSAVRSHIACQIRSFRKAGTMPSAKPRDDQRGSRRFHCPGLFKAKQYPSMSDKCALGAQFFDSYSCNELLSKAKEAARRHPFKGVV